MAGLIVLAFFALLALLIVMAVLDKLGVFASIVHPLLRLPQHVGWMVLLGIAAFNIFAYDMRFGIGYGLFGATITGILLWSFPKEKRGWVPWTIASIGIVSFLLFGFRENEFVQSVNAIAALLCVAALVLLRSVDTIRWHGLWLLKIGSGFFAHFLHKYFRNGKFLSAQEAKKSVIFSIFKTVIITFVLLFFFSMILSAADPFFDKLIAEVRDQALERTFFSLLIAVVLLASMSVAITKSWEERVPQLRGLTFTEMFVPAVSLVLLFALFLGVQAKYLFTSHEAFQLLDITYADYVRKGFIELIIASFVGSLISYLLILKQHALTDRKQIVKLAWVNGILLLELVLLLLSAAKRDFMYVEMYGLTRVRIIGAVFLVWLFGVMALQFVLNAFRSVTERALLIGIIALSAGVVVVLNAVNIDLVIAKAEPPREQPKDIVYIALLSSDAAPAWHATLDNAMWRYEALRTKTSFDDAEKKELADLKIAMRRLLDKAGSPIFIYALHWQEWSWSRSQAMKQLADVQHGFTSENAWCVLRGIYVIQKRTNTDLYDLEYERVYGYESPFIERDFYNPESLDNLGIPAMPDPTKPPVSCV